MHYFSKISVLFVIFSIITASCSSPEVSDDQKNSQFQTNTSELLDEEIFIVVEQQAEFPGGDEERNKYLEKTLSYPRDAKRDAVEGTIFIQFIVEKDGSISNVELANSLYPSLDTMALNAVKNMPKWNPARQRNRVVRSRFVLPITFKMEDDFELFKGVKELIRRIF